MRRALDHILPFLAISVGATAQPSHAQTFSSEFFLDPVSEGWTRTSQFCSPEYWNQDGWYHQALDHDACPPGPEGAADGYRRSMESFNVVGSFFLEFHLWTNGDRSGIPYVTPTVVAMGNHAGVIYHITVASDLVKFLRDVDLLIWFIGIEPDVPHTYRIELEGDEFTFFIDGLVIDKGQVVGPFPAYDSTIVWRGQSWETPCHNAWDYIRYGVIPQDGSGDFDSDGVAALDDFYFFHECLTNDRPGIKGGPDQTAGPGCRFADFDHDGDTDLLDLAAFQSLLSN